MLKKIGTIGYFKNSCDNISFLAVFLKELVILFLVGFIPCFIYFRVNGLDEGFVFFKSFYPGDDVFSYYIFFFVTFFVLWSVNYFTLTVNDSVKKWHTWCIAISREVGLLIHGIFRVFSGGLIYLLILLFIHEPYDIAWKNSGKPAFFVLGCVFVCWIFSVLIVLEEAAREKYKKYYVKN